MAQGDVMNKIETHEMMSALADGQLQGEALARGMEAAAADPAAREAWATYHLIGDILRSGELAVAAPAGDFMDKLSARLALEPVPAPNRPAVMRPMPVGAAALPQEAANDGSFRWKMLAGAASVAAVAAVSWTFVASPAAPLAQPQLAAAPAVVAPAPATVLAGSERGVMIRDPRLDELMAAHRQFGGANALQMPAGFLRNATFEGPAR
jgi:sigma-E factor negative regulatory protein RseA